MASGIVEQESQNSSQQQQQQQPGATAAAPGGNRSQLVQRLLDASSNLPAFVNDLLTTQAVTVAGTEAAGFILERGENNAQVLRPIAHIRPDDSAPDVRAAAIAAFQDLIKPCLQQGRDGAIEVGPAADGAEAQFCLVTLLRNEGEIVAASAVITRCLNVERARQRLMSMQLVAGYFDLFTLRRNADQARNIAQSHQHVLQLATSVATGEGFQAAAMSLCNELAGRAHATRVSLGWVKGKNIKVKALSHTEEFDKKQELVVLLQKVMEECMDQEAIVQFDPNGKGTDNVNRAAQHLSRTQGGHAVLSLPLRRQGDVIGVVTLEFLPSTRIGPQVANGLAIAVDLLAPQLYDRHENDRWLITKAGISSRNLAKATVGPKHMLPKLIAVALIGLVAFAVLYHPMYRVSAPFQFVSQTRYSLSAPYEGKLGDLATVVDPYTKQSRKLRPGDPVSKGQVLVTMDDTEKKLDLLRARAELKRYQGEWIKHLGENKPESPAEALMAKAQMEEAQAQTDLVEQQIARGSITSPMDGVLLQGDLEDKLGAAVKQGEELLLVGQPNALLVEMDVPERDIQYIDEQKKVTIATTSLPGDKHWATVTRIVPIGNANQKEGNNTFKVYASLNGADPAWRPGMAGEAKVDVEKKPVWWIYSHKVFEFIRLQAWKWGV